MTQANWTEENWYLAFLNVIGLLNRMGYMHMAIIHNDKEAHTTNGVPQNVSRTSIVGRIK